MEKQKKSAMVRFPVILLVVSAILLCASPCSALDIEGLVTIPSVDYPDPSYDKVVVKFGGTLNLLVGGVIDGSVNVEEGGKLNLKGGDIGGEILAFDFSEVNITGGNVGGFIIVELFANVTVFGTDFSIENGEIDPSGTYFTQDPDTWPPCLLTVTYGGEAGPIELEFYVYDSDVQIFLAAPPPEVIPEVIIDIKPGSNQNSINLKSKGVVPVAVLTTDGFNAATIDPTTVEFAGASPVKWKLEDVDDDGDDDMMFHFNTEELNLDQDSTEATLTALLLSQEAVSGTDEVRIVPPKK